MLNVNNVRIAGSMFRLTMRRHSLSSSWFIVVLSFWVIVLAGLSSVVVKGIALDTIPKQQHSPSKRSNLSGDWDIAKQKLRDPTCCVVSVNGLQSHLQILQHHLADNGPVDIDLRKRIRIQKQSSSTTTYQDCDAVRQSGLAYGEEKTTTTTQIDDIRDGDNDDNEDDPVTTALIELARGVASLADGPRLEQISKGGAAVDVHMRIVCASNYKANEPPFHTDKAPLRGYVTLRGLGTEYMTRLCTPFEYMSLRTMGVEDDGTASSGSVAKDLQSAKELEFIVMKGDYYDAHSEETSLLSKVWQRTFACIHRSPPSKGAKGGRGGRRVIMSFDLADGDDDREWYEVGKKRKWRNGLTQRKSKLVA